MYQGFNNSVAVGYNGNQLTRLVECAPYSLNIDYLILNLNGELSEDSEAITIYDKNKSVFRLNLLEYGTKIFKNRYEVFFNNQLLGYLMTTPHSKALNENLSQFQFENHWFYTSSMSDLYNIVTDFCNFTSLKFQSINRLDISLDIENKDNFFQKLMNRVLNTDLIVSGKDKKITPYFVTNMGKPDLTGFSIGQRTASRFLRVYNKSLELTKKPKEYILNKWLSTNIDVKNVWRFEYQLNNTFFRNLHKVLLNNDLQIHESELLTYGIFNTKSLLQLLVIAEKNHFQLKYNTGKSQINKEKDFVVINWDYLFKVIGEPITQIKRIKKIVEPSLLSVKRMVKSVFREYYQSKQNSISHILSLNNIIYDYSNELFSLKSWFNDKLHFYINEFQKIQVQNFEFDYSLFKEHSKYSI